MTTIDPESLYVQLGRLVEEWPDDWKYAVPSVATQRWLGRATALVEATGDAYDTGLLKLQVPNLGRPGHSYQASSQIDDETAKLKVTAHDAIWLTAATIKERGNINVSASD